ncbi:MAG: flagellar basal body P-ring formation protein FlgA [Burkholderiaceae bacterium]|nr:flagellar basal body P-ring formation protein FlgA [Burkholderiaceae bacterium]
MRNQPQSQCTAALLARARSRCGAVSNTARALCAGVANAIAAVLFALLAGTAQASSGTEATDAGTAGALSVAAQISAGAQNAARNAIEALMAREGGNANRRIEVQVGQLDPRLQLSACARVEPFLPTGARLWGRSSIGVRCVEGSSWSVLLPVTVQVWGKALIANAQLQVGATPTASDFRVEEIDLTRVSGAVVADQEQLRGRVLSRPLASGQPLRADALKVPPSVSAGDPVRILLEGQGFTITAEGVAVNSAAEGERVRVRTESGKILVGPVRDRAVVLKL